MHRRRLVWQCKACGAQTSVTAGTVMHKTRTPLRLWFWAAYLVATHHPGISAVQLQRQLGIRHHETAWMLLHKLRRAMVAPEREPLKGEVEVDEFFLGGLEEGLSGGRARGKKALVGVAIEVRGQGSGRLRLRVLPDASGDTLEGLVKDTTAAGAIVHTDGWGGYNGPRGDPWHISRSSDWRRSHDPRQLLDPQDTRDQTVAGRHPRFHLHFTPTGSSWINLVKRWFGELTARKLRCGVHRSVRELNADIKDWVARWNENPNPYV
jgi:hypothetical protein